MPHDPLEPALALARLCERVRPVETATLSGSQLDGLYGRVLGETLRLDRDSPACDVSAMDGFAVRFDELLSGALPLEGECRIGEPPCELAVGTALRIYTGSPLPRGVDSVVRLEWIEESDCRIRLNGRGDPKLGGDLRRAGENAKAGDTVLEAGVELSAAAIGAVATIGPSALAMHRPLHVSLITTGNELEVGGLAGAAKPLAAWRLRDSNGPALQCLLSGIGWIGEVVWSHVGDSLEALTQSIASALETSDAVVLTGGVSKGAYDHVPDAVRGAGGEVVFHRIRARPGQPTLGAVADGKPVVGLPGNPLAVLCAGRRLLVPALRKRAGLAIAEPLATVVHLEAWTGKTLPLTWWRPVSLVAPGVARLASLRGSGDVCGPAETDGFIEAPSESDGTGHYSYYAWRV